MVRTDVTRGVANPKHPTFRKRLRKARKAAGMHASALTVAARLGRGMVALWEAGQGWPRLPSIEKLARALGVSPAWLAYGLVDATGTSDAGEGLAERATVARAALGLSMREVARRAKLTEGAVRFMERGRLPAIDTLEQIAKALGVSPSWLAFGVGPVGPPRRGPRPRDPVPAEPDR